jgi:hypothetical protein
MAGDLASTRASLHALAEHILCAARHRATGRIGLEVVPGGFATPPFGEDGRSVGVIGTELVVRAAGNEKRATPATLRQAGELAGIEPGAPAEVYKPVTVCDLDAPLVLDAAWAGRLADWYALGDEALRRFRAEIAEDEPSTITLWPEHLDVAIRAGSVNYGASPGDEHVGEPYVYVGPDVVPGASDGFWNKSFGALRNWAQVPSASVAEAFFRTGRDRVRAA